MKRVKQLPDNLWAPCLGTLRQPQLFNLADLLAVGVSLAGAVGITILNWA